MGITSFVFLFVRTDDSGSQSFLAADGTVFAEVDLVFTPDGGDIVCTGIPFNASSLQMFNVGMDKLPDRVKNGYPCTATVVVKGMTVVIVLPRVALSFTYSENWR